jgi:hypothetical protein
VTNRRAVNAVSAADRDLRERGGTTRREVTDAVFWARLFEPLPPPHVGRPNTMPRVANRAQPVGAVGPAKNGPRHLTAGNMSSQGLVALLLLLPGGGAWLAEFGAQSAARSCSVARHARAVVPRLQAGTFLHEGGEDYEDEGVEVDVSGKIIKRVPSPRSASLPARIMCVQSHFATLRRRRCRSSSPVPAGCCRASWRRRSSTRARRTRRCTR